MAKRTQLDLLKNKYQHAYGGELLKKAKNRTYGRPLSVKQSMHLVLRSTKAKGLSSFATSSNRKLVRQLVNKFAYKYGIRIYNFANVGNHLHLHIKLSNRYAFEKFIRAFTGAIAIKLGNFDKWKGAKKNAQDRFFDYRPFTRIVTGLRAILTLQDYIRLNEIEGYGSARSQARFLVNYERGSPLVASTY